MNHNCALVSGWEYYQKLIKKYRRCFSLPMITSLCLIDYEITLALTTIIRSYQYRYLIYLQYIGGCFNAFMDYVFPRYIKFLTRRGLALASSLVPLPSREFYVNFTSLFLLFLCLKFRF